MSSLESFVFDLLKNNTAIVVVSKDNSTATQQFHSMREYLNNTIRNVPYESVPRDRTLKILSKWRVLYRCKDDIKPNCWQLSSAVVTCQLENELSNYIKSRMRSLDENPSGYLGYFDDK